MAVDFSNLLKKPSGQGKRPPALPKATFPGKVKGFELGDKNKNNTPYVRIHCALTGWPDGIDEADRFQEGENGQRIPIDLSKRQLHRDIFYKNVDGSDATYRLDDFLKSCNLELGAPYEEILPQLAGADILIDVDQYVNQQSGEVQNQVNRVVGVQ